MATRSDPESFGVFFRRYTKTWMHAIATAGLTAFGLLTIFHRGFVVLALACYVVPPIVLYLSRRRDDSTGSSTESPTDAALADQSESDQRTESDSRPLEPSPANREPEPRAEAERESTADTDTGTPATRAPETESDDDDESDAEPRWTAVDTPTDATLFDAAVGKGGPIAVGEGGIILKRDAGDWRTLLEDGPNATGQDLRGVDVTNDGEIAWVAGDGGAVGRLELSSGRHTDYSAPDGHTDNLAGLAVAGMSGDETILLINGSGEVLRGRYREGELSWDGPVKPGSGSSLSSVDLVDASIGYCCDTNDGVFETADGGRTFETVGLESADGTPTGIAAGGRGDCHVSTDAGVVHRYDGSTWTPERLGEVALTGIARRGEHLVVCSEDGAVHERSGPTADWVQFETGVGERLEASAIEDDQAVAVGGSGTILERR